MKRALLIFTLLPGFATAAQPETWYPARVVRVIDGDTIAMAVDIWPGLTQQATVRVFRIDTPELRASQQCEKAGSQGDAVHEGFPGRQPDMDQAQCV